MRLNKTKLAFIAAWTFAAVGAVYPQSATDHLQRLVEMSAQRLVIAEQIALAKWDSGTPVEDTFREAQIIASAIKVGESRGLDPATVSNFFRAQIEANKLVQYSLLAEWRRLGNLSQVFCVVGEKQESSDQQNVYAKAIFQPESVTLNEQRVTDMTRDKFGIFKRAEILLICRVSDTRQSC
jgi:chorismate mutase-like protein